LILVICGIELNIISLKKQVKIVKDGAPQRAVDVYRKELFLNLNYYKKVKKVDKKAAPAEDVKVSKFNMK
jgi:sRNA-binding carbon storage regulator CsrA